MSKRKSEEQTIALLKRAEAGEPIYVVKKALAFQSFTSGVPNMMTLKARN